ncbi:MAG: HypC/HybG/HupF family hydrogenase formation chaperone [Terriglobales bacterium]
MCLAIPGKVVQAYEARGLPMAKVQFGAITREACLAYVPQAAIGDYVLVHVGFAISQVNQQEAERTYALLQELDQLTELEAPVVGEAPAAGSGDGAAGGGRGTE